MRFTIRDVLWLTLMVGILAGWGIDHARQIASQAQVKAAIYSSGQCLVEVNGRRTLATRD